MSFDPKRTPAYKKAEAIAKQEYARMDDKEKKHAHTALKINEMNLPGMPAFFPTGISVALAQRCYPAVECSTEGCGGCCIRIDGYICPRCGKNNSENSIER